MTERNQIGTDRIEIVPQDAERAASRKKPQTQRARKKAADGAGKIEVIEDSADQKGRTEQKRRQNQRRPVRRTTDSASRVEQSGRTEQNGRTEHAERAEQAGRAGNAGKTGNAAKSGSTRRTNHSSRTNHIANVQNAQQQAQNENVQGSLTEAAQNQNRKRTQKPRTARGQEQAKQHQPKSQPQNENGTERKTSGASGAGRRKNAAAERTEQAAHAEELQAQAFDAQKIRGAEHMTVERAAAEHAAAETETAIARVQEAKTELQTHEEPASLPISALIQPAAQPVQIQRFPQLGLIQPLKPKETEVCAEFRPEEQPDVIVEPLQKADEEQVLESGIRAAQASEIVSKIVPETQIDEAQTAEAAAETDIRKPEQEARKEKRPRTGSRTKKKQTADKLAEKAANGQTGEAEHVKSAAEVLREQREARNRQGGRRQAQAQVASVAVEFSPEQSRADETMRAQSAGLLLPAAAGTAAQLLPASDKARVQVKTDMKRSHGKRTPVKKHEHVKIIPLGGLEQIGMNITAFEYKDSIIVVDCGMAFPEDDMLGIDLVVPDVTYLKKNASKVRGFFITHGHEDHIGALPYVLRELNVPVYSTRLTIALIENKLREAQLLDSAKLNIVKHGDVVPAGDFQIEFIKTNHSIQDASALAIHSPAGIIFHTGDFKVDYTPVFGDAIDLQRFAELGKQGVLALMADSMNALRPGFTMSERTVGHTFDTIFAEHPNNRIIIATFASNVDRVQQVINDAEKYDRKVVIEGRSMVNVIGTAAELGYIKIKDGTLIDIAQLKDYPPEKTVLVTTGSQGEAMAALSRMASGQHRKVTIMPNDVIVLSSTPIPGNEKAVAKVINELAQRHAEIINQDTHVSGHACQEELKLIYSLIRPKFAIPVHGEYRHRVAQKKIAESVGIPPENILIADTGDVIDLSEDGCKVVDHVQAGPLMVDGLGVGDVGNIVMRDRQNLAQNGIIVVVLAYERRTNRMVGGPDIVSRGFVYVRENEELMEDARVAVMDAVDDCETRRINDWSRIKNEIRDALSDFFWKRMKRTPVILPIITEIS